MWHDSWGPKCGVDSFALSDSRAQSSVFLLSAFLPLAKDISFMQVWCQRFEHCCVIAVLIPLPYWWLVYFNWSQLSFAHRGFVNSGLWFWYLTFPSRTLLTHGHALSLQRTKWWVEGLSGQLLKNLPVLRGFVQAQLHLEDISCHGINICTYDMFVNSVSC